MAMRPLFPPRSVALLREMNRSNLPDRADCYVLGTEAERQPGGVYGQQVVPLGFDLPCRVAPLDLRVPGEKATADQWGPDAKWIVTFEAGTILPSVALLRVRGETAGTAWELVLQVLGTIHTHNDMLARIACQVAPEALVDMVPER